MVRQLQELGVHVRRRSILLILLIGQALASIDGSIVSVSAPSIQADLGGSSEEIQLVLSSYLLTTGVLFVTCARIGDVIGHQRAFLVGLGWFTGASLLCGVSLNPSMLILARIAQAMGASLLMPQVFSLIHRQWDGDRRRRAIGVYSMVLALGVAIGQVIGGLLASADLFGLAWRPVFLLNVPIGMVILVVGRRRWPTSFSAEPARLDPVGVALLALSMTAITVPLIFSQVGGWPGSALLGLAGGLLLLALFILYERKARYPVLDIAVLRQSAVQFGLTSCCILMGCYTAFLLILTVHLQHWLGFTPLEAGLAFVPYAAGFGLLSLTWSYFPLRCQKLLPIIGPLVFALSALLAIALFRDQWQPSGTIPLLLFAGVGHAAGYSPLIAQITARVKPRQASSLSALNSTGPVLAEVMGVAGLGSVYFAADSSAGIMHVTVAIAALLAIAVACAARTASILRDDSSQIQVPTD